MSANTVANRITELSGNVKQQLIQKSHEFETFSIALDESTDVSDTVQCAVFIRGVDVNLNITEELLDLVPLKGTTTGRDIFQGREECIEKAALPWSKLVPWLRTVHQQCVLQTFAFVGLLVQTE